MFSSLQQTPSFPYETEKIQGNDHLKISASASRRWHCHQSRYSNTTRIFGVKRQFYIFLSNTLFSIKSQLQACDFVRKCFSKISHRKFLDYSRSSTLENGGVFFNGITGIGTRPATLVKKSLHQGILPVNIFMDTRRPYMSFLF